ncbi:hypothetical protein JW921_06840 [Candidatus Fermentibacterales bacterium]|nr:hypothetical protein [Candidatus Fermentibacterales bacterium]
MRATLAAALLLLSLSRAGVFTVTADNASAREQPDGEVIIDLQGNVVVTDGEVSVYAPQGRVWQNQERALFEGGVRIVADSLEGTGETLLYDRGSGTVILTGGVVLSDSDNTLEAHEVTYYRESGKALARDSVVMRGPWLGEVRGEYALYDRDRGSLFVTESPVLIRAEDGDTMTVHSDRLEFFPDSSRAEAQGNVRIDVPSESFTATAEYATYYGDEERIELVGSPVLSSPDGELSGDWQELLLDEREIESVRVDGNSKGHFVDREQDPPGETWMSAQHALFVFSGGLIDSVSLSGSAEVTVQSGGEAASRAETNTVRGEILTFEFDDGTLEVVTASGGVAGTYGYHSSD